MYEVYHNEGISLNDLSTKLDLPKSSVSRLVDQLVNSEIIIREIPKENRRIVKLSMSPSFLQNKNITDMNAQFNDTISGKLDGEKAERIIFALEELNNIIDRDKK
jgi:Transcriptional regulators